MFPRKSMLTDDCIGSRERVGSVDDYVTMMTTGVDAQLRLQRLTTELANERTLLAWIRTVVSVYGWSVTMIGMAKEDLSLGYRPSAVIQSILGSACMVLCIALFCFGAQRCYRIKAALKHRDPTLHFKRIGFRWLLYLLVPIVFLGAAGYWIYLYNKWRD